MKKIPLFMQIAYKKYYTQKLLLRTYIVVGQSACIYVCVSRSVDSECPFCFFIFVNKYRHFSSQYNKNLPGTTISINILKHKLRTLNIHSKLFYRSSHLNINKEFQIS